MIDLNKPFWQWMVILFLAFIWGSSFILMKRGLTVFSSDQVATIRIFISFIVLAPIAFRSLKKVQLKEWKFLIIVGLFGTGLPAFLFAFAQSHINSSLAGMLNSLVPFFTLLLGVLIFGVSFKMHRIIGVFVGLFGAIGLLGIGGEEDAANDWRYGGLVVIATLCYAISVNVIKKYLPKLNALAITSVSILIIGPLAGLYLFSTDFTAKLSFESDTLIALFSILALGIFGTAMAIVIFNMLIKQVSALFAASVTYLIPIFAIMWGLVDGESVSSLQLLSIGIILTGVYIVNKP